jgi:eukaryotic translation initiation factor 2C
MLQVPATTLPYPKPRYGKGSVGVDMRNPNWDLRNRKFLLTNPRKTFKAFIIAVPRGVGGRSIFDDPKILENTFGEFKNAVQDTYATASFSVVGSMMNRNIGANPAVLEGSMEQAKAKGANFVMLFLEKANTPAYSTFKDLADRKFGMHSLCIVWKGKPSGLQYWGNVAMKINLKAGGTNHTTDGVEHILKDTLVLGA